MGLCPPTGMRARGVLTADAGKRPEGLRRFATFLSIVVVATFTFTSVAFLALRPGPEAPLQLVSVRAEPAVPVPDRSLTVLATAVGGSPFSPPTVWLFHATSFRNERVSVERMQSQGGGAYALTIGPFANGAEVWMFAAATTMEQGPVFSEHLILDVGTVYRNSTLLAVGNTFHSPGSPGPQTAVTVFTEVESIDFVASVFLSYGWFGRGTSGAGSRFMSTGDGVHYESFLETRGFGRTFPAATRLFYRVAANDFSGVAANSQVAFFDVDTR